MHRISLAISLGLVSEKRIISLCLTPVNPGRIRWTFSPQSNLRPVSRSTTELLSPVLILTPFSQPTARWLLFSGRACAVRVLKIIIDE